MQRDKVGLLQYLIQTFGNPYAWVTTGIHFDKRVKHQHGHLNAQGADLGHASANPSKPNHTQQLVTQLFAAQFGIRIPLPGA